MAVEPRNRVSIWFHLLLMSAYYYWS